MFMQNSKVLLHPRTNRLLPSSWFESTSEIVWPVHSPTNEQMRQRSASLVCKFGLKFSDLSADLWGLVNNAGVVNMGEVELVPLDVIQCHFDVNVLGTIRMCKAFLPALRRSRGRVVNVSSVMGKEPQFSSLTPWSNLEKCVAREKFALREKIISLSLSVSLCLSLSVSLCLSLSLSLSLYSLSLSVSLCLSLSLSVSLSLCPRNGNPRVGHHVVSLVH